MVIPKAGFLELNLKQIPAQYDGQWTAIYVEDGTARADSTVAGVVEVDMLIEGRKADMCGRYGCMQRRGKVIYRSRPPTAVTQHVLFTDYRSSSKLELDIGLRLLLAPREELGRNTRSSLRRRFHRSLDANPDVSDPAPG